MRRASVPFFGWALPVVGMALAGSMWVADRPRPSERDPAPIDVASDPFQRELETGAPQLLKRGSANWRMTPLAEYVGRGVVLSRRGYGLDREGDLAPVDVAIAWGALANGRLYERISWSQSHRWYWWTYGEDFTQGDEFVARHSANIHVIPATDNLKRAALSLHSGDPVELEGRLVRIENAPGQKPYSWVSSLSREDEGNGSCEVLYLTRLKTGANAYR